MTPEAWVAVAVAVATFAAALLGCVVRITFMLGKLHGVMRTTAKQTDARFKAHGERFDKLDSKVSDNNKLLVAIQARSEV